jgi:hypothetical protein
VISYDSILANWNVGQNYSETDLHIEYGLALYVYNNGTTDFRHELYSNNFTVGIRLISNITEASTDVWAMVSQIITLQIPNVGPLVNAMVGIPVSFGICFVLLTLISRFIPFISGG